MAGSSERTLQEALLCRSCEFSHREMLRLGLKSLTSLDAAKHRGDEQNPSHCRPPLKGRYFQSFLSALVLESPHSDARTAGPLNNEPEPWEMLGTNLPGPTVSGTSVH